MSTQNLLNDSAKKLSDDRGAVYGDYRETADMAQRLKELLRSSKFSASQMESLDNICTKLARLRCGDPNDLDSWRDVVGYSNLIVKQLAEKENNNGLRIDVGSSQPSDKQPFTTTGH